MANRAVQWDDAALAAKLQAMPELTHRGLSAIMMYQSARIQKMMRVNAPWTDRTTNARNGLFARTVIDKQKTYAIVMHHSVPYGIWLEVRWSGKYSVIARSLQPEGVQVMMQVAKLFDRIFT